MPAEIGAVRAAHTRVGVSGHLDQQRTEGLGVFARVGWSQGQVEVFACSDIKTTDAVGLAVAVHEASGAAKPFVAAGGLGILVGDGQLVHAGPASIVETSDSVAVFPCATLALASQLSLSRLNHWLPGCEAHPEVVQGTTDFHYDIAGALFPQAHPIFHNATALDTAVHMLAPQPPLVERLVGTVLFPRQLLAAGFLGRHEDRHL